MTPCPPQLPPDGDCSSNGHDKPSSSEEAVVIYPPDGSPAYVECHSTKPFVNPTTAPHLTPEQINQLHLNLNLGQNLVDPEKHVRLLQTIRFWNNLLLGWWEHALFRFWNRHLPTGLKRFLTFTAWNLYLPLHKLLLGRRTGIHTSVSEEYHALTTVLWWGRFFPVSVERMRFSLSQLTICQPNPVLSRVETVAEPHCPMKPSQVPSVQQEHCQVEGLFLHVNKKPSEYTIFWLYGGAFLSGDSHGNLGPAEKIGRATGMDVFLPTYRLVPEAVMDDLLWDVSMAYHWLVTHRKGGDASKVILLGISSGAALCTRLMQLHAEQSRGEDLVPSYVSPLMTGQPGGAVLLCPYVDYTEPASPTGSFSQYKAHDLIVTPRVMESGLPYLDTHLGGDRKASSPVHRSFEGLPPLCVVASEHEVVYDQTIALVNGARSQGVKVSLGLWKYVCHAFPFLNGFIPEAEASLKFVIEWIHELTKDEEDCI